MRSSTVQGNASRRQPRFGSRQERRAARLRRSGSTGRRMSFTTGLFSTLAAAAFMLGHHNPVFVGSSVCLSLLAVGLFSVMAGSSRSQRRSVGGLWFDLAFGIASGLMVAGLAWSLSALVTELRRPTQPSRAPLEQAEEPIESVSSPPASNTEELTTTEEPKTALEPRRPETRLEKKQADPSAEFAAQPVPQPGATDDSATEPDHRSSPVKPADTQRISTRRRLPAGTRLQLVTVEDRLIRFRVELAANQYQPGLQKADFALRSDFGPIDAFSVVECPRRVLARATSMVILLDESASGTERSAMLRAAGAVIRAAPFARYHVAGVGATSLRILQPWTASEQAAIASMERLSASSGGLMCDAVRIKTSELAARPGIPLVVVFSTESGVRTDAGLLRSGEHSAKVRVLPVRVGALYGGVSRLRILTNGEVYSASDPEGLALAVRRLTTRSEAPAYDIRLPSEPAWPLQLTAGGGATAPSITVSPHRR